MRAILLSLGVLGLAALLARVELVPASTRVVMPDDVQLVAEQVNSQPDVVAGKNGRNSRKGGLRGRAER